MQTQTASQEWTFEDLYNVLMERIEPELCTYNLDQIEEIYTDETQKDHAMRYEHYARCLELFWDALKELIDMTKADLKDFEDEFFNRIKSRIAGEEEGELSDIADSIADA